MKDFMRRGTGISGRCEEKWNISATDERKWNPIFESEAFLESKGMSRKKTALCFSLNLSFDQ